jgi:hypothetical protein
MGAQDHGQPSGIRISDADRERAAQRLHQALGEGRITVSEIEERLAVVYAARFEADLRPPLADLPPVPDVLSAHSGIAATPSGPPLVLRAGMSSIRRAGEWDVPARLRIHTGMGSVLLDFSAANNPHPVVEVELELGAGSAKLLMPSGATANVDDMVAGLGSVKSKVPARHVPGHPHFVVHGRTGLGSVVVRRPYRFRGRAF